MRYAKHILMLLFICFILVPVVLSRMKEGYCDEDIYRFIRQKFGDTTIQGTVSVDNCNSDYYKLIKSRLDGINFSAPSVTFSSYESGILPSTSKSTSTTVYVYVYF